MSVVLEARAISKSFPGVQALDQVDVAIERGSCHALMGENGAGKSTLGKIFAGLYQPDAGEVLLEGRPVRFSGPLAALRAGIAMVHQELVFCENLSVAENLCLDALPSRGPFLDRRAMRDRAARWLESIQAPIDPDTRVGELPIAKQQLVQIAGAVGRDARVILFDEPTSSLTARESDILFEQIRTLQARGVTFLYVSHRMDEVFTLCDTVTVLRDGRLVDTTPIAELDRESLVRKMIGRTLEAVDRAPQSFSIGKELLRVEGLTRPGVFEEISFSVREGEILGFAGLVGAGRTEIAEALFGLAQDVQGSATLHDAPLAMRRPGDALARGLGLVPEDRKRHGLVLSMNARENISLPTLDACATLGWVRIREERALANRFFELMRVKAPSIEADTIGLSGGNQQKLVIAKWLAAHCDVLLLDEPTRGVDVGAKAEIHELIRDLAREGKAVIVISSELPELLALSSRILALREGRLAGEIARSDFSEERVMRLMTGVA
ncbi:MAG TPA: sugar ABC transporter ATP-binding protein [Fimbriimonadaceae bacterium]|nr:sugar ABC transporter ATP-binding protein [Fimbriimonadaceae bacterium]